MIPDTFPTRENLLDIDWLTRTYREQGMDKLVAHIRAGAERYGGPVTAIAEAMINSHPLNPSTVGRHWPIDLEGALAELLIQGSWTTDPDGPRKHRNSGWLRLPDKRAEYSATHPQPPPRRLPNLHTLRLIEPFDCAWAAHTDGIWGCEVSHDGKHMVSASRDGDVAVWDMQTGTLVARARTRQPDVRDCAFTSDGTRVIYVHQGGPLIVSDLQTMTAHARVDVPGRIPRRTRIFAISEGDSLLAISGSDGIDIRDLRTFELLTRLPPVDEGATTIALRFDSRDRLTCAVLAGWLRIVTWDWGSHQVTNTMELPGPPTGGVNRAVITRDGRHFIAATDHDTTVWQIATAATLSQVPYGTFGEALAVSADGTRAATCDRESRERWEPVVRVWSVPDLRELWQLRMFDFGCRDIACALAFAPDRHGLIIAGWEGGIRRAVISS